MVCLGATAAQSFFGRRFTLLKNRGRVFQTPWADAVVVTYHPSALLRMEEPARAQAYGELVADLVLAARHADTDHQEHERRDREKLTLSGP